MEEKCSSTCSSNLFSGIIFSCVTVLLVLYVVNCTILEHILIEVYYLVVLSYETLLEDSMHKIVLKWYTPQTLLSS